MSGLVKISKVDLEGHEKTLAIFRSAEVLGEWRYYEDQRGMGDEAQGLLHGIGLGPRGPISQRWRASEAQQTWPPAAPRVAA